MTSTRRLGRRSRSSHNTPRSVSGHGNVCMEASDRRSQGSAEAANSKAPLAKKALGRRRTKGPVSLNRQIRRPNKV